MRSMLCSILALTILFVSGAVHAQTGDAPSGATAPPVAAAAKEKQKEMLLRFLDDAESLATWVPNEPSFRVALTRAHDQLAAAEEAELAPLREFEPHFSHLEATLARMRVRMKSVQTAAELCDPARSGDLFLLLLDTLDAEGQRGVTAKICKKLASLEGVTESLAQVCVASNLAFQAARSMHDLVIQCDPTLDRASVDGSAERFDQLHADLAGVKAGVQESVRAAKRDLTQAMTLVAGHVSEVSSANTTSLHDIIQAGNDHTVRLEIERALEAGKPYGVLCLPQAYGGQLESVRAIVIETIHNVVASGETQDGASAKLAAGDAQFHSGHYKKAFRLYSEAYVAAVGIAAGEP